MTGTNIQKATHAGELKVGEKINIRCYVLEDMTRILAYRNTTDALANPENYRQKSGQWMQRLARNEAIKPHFSEELIQKIENPIEFIPPGQKAARGIEASLLVDICDALWEARKKGSLKEKNPYFEASIQAETMIRAFAKVGIVALVDEATGYQEIREKDALKKILEKYISPILLPYATRFPREFYLETYKLRGWDYTPIQQGKGAKTPLLGKITNDVIYNRLVPGALEKLQELNPERDNHGRLKHHHHRHLTDAHGIPALDKHIASVITIMKLSDSWEDFYKKLNKVHPHYRNSDIEDSTQLKLDMVDANKLEDSFDRALVKAVLPDQLKQKKVG